MNQKRYNRLRRYQRKKRLAKELTKMYGDVMLFGTGAIFVSPDRPPKHVPLSELILPLTLNK